MAIAVFDTTLAVIKTLLNFVGCVRTSNEPPNGSLLQPLPNLNISAICRVVRKKGKASSVSSYKHAESVPEPQTTCEASKPKSGEPDTDLCLL